MKVKNLKLVKSLFDAQPATSSMLADRLSISVRSVKNYIYEINTKYPNAITSSREGYRIDPNIAKEILSAAQHRHIPETSEERVIFILLQLLEGSQKATVNMYDLCEKIFVSMSTLKNELHKAKRRLKQYDLELVTQGDEVSLKGLEKNKRKILSSILYDESNVNFVNLDSLQKAFKDIDIHYIKTTVLSIFERYHYFINDYSLINLVLHITISIDRIRNNNINMQSINEKPAVRLHEYEIAQTLAKQLEEYFDIKYSDAEVYEMTLLIISRATTIDYKSINSTNLVEFIGKDCLDLVQELIQNISSYYYIDLSEQEFLIRFALHIKNLLVRSRNNYFNKNPLTGGIKTSCPLIYDVSVSLAATIKEKTGMTINDDEIAYIAFHLGSTLEAQKSLDNKITAILYYPNYYDMNLRITDLINQHFADELLITNILTDESEFENVVESDLIITTIPISKVLTTPIIQINPFFNERDRTTLKSRIEILKKEKQQKEFEEYLRELLIPDFFEIKHTPTTKEDCITYMVDKLVTHEYVNPSFENEILERESISSTAYGNFAIPHAMKMNAHKTGMNIIISEQPIDWGNHPVNLIIMLCFNKNERHIFNEIFDPLTMILSEVENTKKILESKSYDEFIRNLVSLL